MVASQRIIPRERVIPGARDDDYHVDSTYHTSQQPRTASVTLTKTDMVALNATPVTLLADPPAGHKYVVLACHVNKATGGYGAGAPVTVNHTDTDSTVAASFPLARFTAAAVQNQWISRTYTGDVDDVTDPDGGLDINVGTAFTDAGDDGGDVTITVRYIQVEG